MIRHVFLPLALVLALASTGLAEKFLPEDCSALVNLLPPPPASDSPAGRADLDTVLEVQADRTPAQIARAKRVAGQSVTSFARPVLGDWFHAKDFPRTMAVFDEIGREAHAIVDGQVKKRWNRTRPYDFSPDVQPVVDRPRNASYPSGHSSDAAIWGTILAAAFPVKAAEFKKQIHEAMWSRVIGGAHYPSDTEAGALLGQAIAETMLKSPDMQSALDVIRAEVGPHLKAGS